MEREKLRKADLQRWSLALIKRFKLPFDNAFDGYYFSRYTTQDLNQHLRIWIHQMIQYAKAINNPSNSLLEMIWTSFEPRLQLDIPEPTPTTTMIDFLESIDAVYPGWVTKSQYGEFPPCGVYDSELVSWQRPWSSSARKIAHTSTS